MKRQVTQEFDYGITVTAVESDSPEVIAYLSSGPRLFQNTYNFREFVKVMNEALLKMEEERERLKLDKFNEAQKFPERSS